MKDWLSGSPEQNPRCNRGTQGNRKPSPTGQDRLSCITADADFAQRRKVNDQHEHYAAKSRPGEKPVKSVNHAADQLPGTGEKPVGGNQAKG